MPGLQAVQPVVVSAVEFSLHRPVEQRFGEKLHEGVVESGDEGHVKGKTPTGHAAHYPGAPARAEERLGKEQSDGM